MQSTVKLLPSIRGIIESFNLNGIADNRKTVLHQFIDSMQAQIDRNKALHLNFICTHNSRRSQLSQIWATVAAHYYGIETVCYSGGVEVTAFNERAVASIQRFGFKASFKGINNPHYQVQFAENAPVLICYSKLYDAPENNCDEFIAVMTCAEADDNCPIIPAALERIPLRYDDPKAFDDTDLESEKYDERSRQIGTELFYVFSQLKIKK